MSLCFANMCLNRRLSIVLRFHLYWIPFKPPRFESAPHFPFLLFSTSTQFFLSMPILSVPSFLCMVCSIQYLPRSFLFSLSLMFLLLLARSHQTRPLKSSHKSSFYPKSHKVLHGGNLSQF